MVDGCYCAMWVSDEFMELYFPNNAILIVHQQENVKNSKIPSNSFTIVGKVVELQRKL